MMNIKEKLQAIFRDIFDDDEIVITNETIASDIEDWDSLSHIQLIVAIENRFDVKLKTGEIIKLKNVGDFITLLKHSLNKTHEK
jgi:acyl carrier protein